jgi:hypothetical protein
MVGKEQEDNDYTLLVQDIVRCRFIAIGRLTNPQGGARADLLSSQQSRVSRVFYQPEMWRETPDRLYLGVCKHYAQLFSEPS